MSEDREHSSWTVPKWLKVTFGAAVAAGVAAGAVKVANMAYGRPPLPKINVACVCVTTK